MDRSFIPIGPRHSLYVLHLNPATSTKIKTDLPVLQMTANINSPHDNMEEKSDHKFQVVPYIDLESIQKFKK